MRHGANASGKLKLGTHWKCANEIRECSHLRISLLAACSKVSFGIVMTWVGVEAVPFSVD